MFDNYSLKTFEVPTTYFYISTSFQATIIQALVGSKKVTLVKSISHCAQKSGAIF